MATLKYWLWLSSRRGLGPTGTLRVLDHFATPERAFYADPEEYDQIEGLSAFAREMLRDRDTGAADRILADCDRLGLKIMTLQDADYPERLRQLPDAPAVLYLRGKAFAFDEEVAIGMVGARDATEYGLMAAGQIAMEISRGGGLVVSGIAQGIDSAVLQGALKGGGPVVSVLGGGVDVYYPWKNRFLYEDVAAAGTLISEYPPGTETKAEHFPVRNRIISGLTLGVVAVEARIVGGTMITMNRALEQNRDLFAVPGNIGAPMSRGTNLLIQQGAKLVTCGRDVLEEYWDRFPAKLAPSTPLSPAAAAARLGQGPRPATSPPPPDQQQEPDRKLVPLQEQREQFTDDELALLRALGKKRRSADDLVEATQIPARRVLSALTMLQVRSAVEQGPDRRFSAQVALEA